MHRDPVGWTVHAEHRLAKGGAWWFFESSCTTIMCYPMRERNFGDTCGFRPVCNVRRSVQGEGKERYNGMESTEER
jgi:hypothetical protein